MNAKKKGKFLIKSTQFNGKEMKLYSLDGIIWSTRQWELPKIQERHEAQRITLDPNLVKEEEGVEKVAEELKDELDEIADIVVVDDKEPKGKSAKKAAGKIPAKGEESKAKVMKAAKAPIVTPKARQLPKAVKKGAKGSAKRRAA